MLVRLLARVPLTCHTSSQASAFLKAVPHILNYPSLIPHVRTILQQSPSSPIATILLHSDDFSEVTYALTLARNMKLAPSTSTTDMIESHLHRRDVTTHNRSVYVPQLAQYFSGLQYYSNRSLQYLPTPEFLPLNILRHLHISYNNCTLSNLADVLYNCKLLGIPESNPAIRTLVDAIPRIASPQKTTSASLSSIYGIVIVSAQYQISNSVIKQYICPLILQNCRSKQHVFSSNTKLMVILRILLIREARTGTRFMSDAEYIEILTRMVDQEEKAEKPPSVVYLSYLLTVAFDLALKKRILAMLQKFRNYDERLTRENILMILGNLFRFYWDSTHDAIHSILAVLDNVLVTLPK
eukprot:PhF_6_TR7932/c1_g1_i4/m.11916